MTDTPPEPTSPPIPPEPTPAAQPPDESAMTSPSPSTPPSPAPPQDAAPASPAVEGESPVHPELLTLERVEQEARRGNAREATAADVAELVEAGGRRSLPRLLRELRGWQQRVLFNSGVGLVAMVAAVALLLLSEPDPLLADAVRSVDWAQPKWRTPSEASADGIRDHILRETEEAGHRPFPLPVFAEGDLPLRGVTNELPIAGLDTITLIYRPIDTHRRLLVHLVPDVDLETRFHRAPDTGGDLWTASIDGHRIIAWQDSRRLAVVMVVPIDIAPQAERIARRWQAAREALSRTASHSLSP